MVSEEHKWLDVVFGDGVRNRRKELGMTQTELGKLLGVSKFRICEIDRKSTRLNSSHNRSCDRSRMPSSA
jgi:transcriptional regulator with XRE-family HTH domain